MTFNNDNPDQCHSPRSCSFFDIGNEQIFDALMMPRLAGPSTGRWGFAGLRSKKEAHSDLPMADSFWPSTAKIPLGSFDSTMRVQLRCFAWSYVAS
jgi:hypothetical protein